MAPLVALGGGWLSPAGALPWLVSAAAARVDGGLAIVAVGAWSIGRGIFYANSYRPNLFTGAGLAVARGGGLCLWVLGIPANLFQHRFRQRARLLRCPLSAARQDPIARQSPSEVSKA